MRATITIVAVVLTLAAFAWAETPSPSPTPTPQVAQAAPPQIESAEAFAARMAAPPIATQPDSDDEIEKAVRDRIPHGAADPQYTDPVIGQASPRLSVEFAGGVRTRPWTPAGVQQADGSVAHAPLWFEDPLGLRGIYGGKDVTALAAAYSPMRFAVNLVALPVTMIIHPVWQKDVTDRTDGPQVGSPTTESSRRTEPSSDQPR